MDRAATLSVTVSVSTLPEEGRRREGIDRGLIIFSKPRIAATAFLQASKSLATMLALTLGSAQGFVINGIATSRPVMPTIHMNAAEAAAKAKWLASIESEPSWVGGGRPAPTHSNRNVGSVAPSSGFDDHTHPSSRIVSSEWGRVPMSTPKWDATGANDDHSNPSTRLGENPWGRVPMAAPKWGGTGANDDHTNPDSRIAASEWGRVPMATPKWDTRTTNDDHTYPTNRMSESDWGRVPMATTDPNTGRVVDDHTDPSQRIFNPHARQ